MSKEKFTMTEFSYEHLLEGAFWFNNGIRYNQTAEEFARWLAMKDFWQGERGEGRMRLIRLYSIRLLKSFWGALTPIERRALVKDFKASRFFFQERVAKNPKMPKGFSLFVLTRYAKKAKN